MVRLQRPKTLREFIIQSLLTSRGPLPTLVDGEDEEPTTVLRRPDAEEWDNPRDTLLDL
jgi:hypothetical protein